MEGGREGEGDELWGLYIGKMEGAEEAPCFVGFWAAWIRAD
jgi:hypothetical protein